MATGRTVLEAVGEGIWLAEGGCVSFYGFAYPTRCVIVRLGGGDLWVWSPVMDEVVVLHRASRTVIVADLIENFSERFLRAHWRW